VVFIDTKRPKATTMMTGSTRQPSDPFDVGSQKLNMGHISTTPKLVRKVVRISALRHIRPLLPL
jgi:hypothetical protein